MEILFATKNKAKLKHYAQVLSKYNIEVRDLNDLEINVKISEAGKNSMENAILKATEYAKLSGMLTIAEDTCLEFEGVPEDVQPGVFVRRVNKKDDATDAEMIEHYTSLVSKYGKDGKLNGKWIKTVAICDNDCVKCCTFNTEKIFTNKVSSNSHEGYPLDSMSITPYFNKYTIDLTDAENKELKEIQNKEMIEFFDEYFKRRR